MRCLFVLGVVVLVDGLLVLADAHGLQLLAVALVLAGIAVTSVYIWRSQKRQRRHRRWFEEG
jgi:hypothetical protein